MNQNDQKRLKRWVLECLSMDTIDETVILAMQSTTIGVGSFLISILEGKIQVSEYQLRNAMYVLGKLRERKAIPHLCKALDNPSLLVRIHALNALAEIGVDEQTRQLLHKYAWDLRTEPVEVAYAMRAMARADDVPLTFMDELQKQAPPHMTDTGVREAYAYLMESCFRRNRTEGKPRLPKHL